LPTRHGSLLAGAAFAHAFGHSAAQRVVVELDLAVAFLFRFDADFDEPVFAVVFKPLRGVAADFLFLQAAKAVPRKALVLIDQDPVVFDVAYARPLRVEQVGRAQARNHQQAERDEGEQAAGHGEMMGIAAGAL